MEIKSIKINDLVNRQYIAVAKDCHLCGTTFTTELEKTICPKCKELWKEFIKSREVE